MTKISIVKISSALIALLLFTTGCSWFSHSTADHNRRNALYSDSCPHDDELYSALRSSPAFTKSLVKSIEYYSRQPASKTLIFGKEEIPVGKVLLGYSALLEWLTSSSDTAPVNIIPHCFKPSTDSVLLTGYYEGSLKGSLKKSSRYAVPVYGVPSDLITANLSDFTSQEIPANFPKKLTGRVDDQKLIPYYNREEISFQEKLHEHKPMLYVDDPLKLFFAHIQGSTVVELPSGNLVYLGFGGQNGYPYKSIGKYMIDRGYLDREHSSGEDIMRYLRTHRDHVREILSQNPSFIFFKKMPPGPFGNIGVALTPRHSVATDSGLMPAGALILLSTTLTPLERDGPTEALHLHPVMNQDTGGAIKSPRRMDLFLGRGVQNEYQAAHLKSEADAVYVYFEVR